MGTRSRRGGSNEYPQSMFWIKNKKIGIPVHTPILLNKSGVGGGWTEKSHRKKSHGKKVTGNKVTGKKVTIIKDQEKIHISVHKCTRA